MSEKYRLVYGYGEYVEGHEDFKTWEEREAWSAGFSTGCLQHGGEGCFTMGPDDIEYELEDLAEREKEHPDSYSVKQDKVRIENVREYLNKLDAKAAYEGK